MQLKKQPTSIRAALAAATCTLLAQPLVAAAQGSSTDEDDWDVQSGLLFYDETDRIQVIEPVITASKTLENGDLLTLRGVIDTITGASPNGATPTDTAQTFTSPSGDIDTTAAGETPMRSTQDMRRAFDAEWEMELSRMVRNTLSGSISNEEDFLSLSIADTVKLDLNKRHTTLAAGFAMTMDTISVEGGTPIELELLSAPAPVSTDDDGMHKNSVELLLGVTQIIDRKTLTQLNYSVSHSSGYLTDPYKFLSVIEPVTGNTLDYRYEKRPDSRTSHILNWRLNHQFNEDVIYLGYRYFMDDWGINAHTADIKYRSELGNGRYLQPHLRFYQQTAADFFRHSLVEGDPLPTHASSDLRLGEMTGRTIGVKFGMPLAGGDFTVRIEQMVQEGESSPADAIGIQQNYDLYPTLTANIIQFGYRFLF
ncbi:MAG: DUF3570 domain-containing protein [Pseudomonadota bacterium]